jgi:hypothetical protein
MPLITDVYILTGKWPAWLWHGNDMWRVNKFDTVVGLEIAAVYIMRSPSICPAFIHFQFLFEMMYFTYLLTHGAEPFWRSRQFFSYSRISQHFMEPTPWSSQWSLSFWLSHQYPIRISHLRTTVSLARTSMRQSGFERVHLECKLKMLPFEQTCSAFFIKFGVK